MAHSTSTYTADGHGTTQVFAFVDTNVLLHYQFFRDVNWAKELRADEATLVFAPVVVDELDQRKWAGARRERARAKRVLRALKDLGLSVTPVEMRPGVRIVAIDEEPPDALFVRHRLRPQVNDDRLLASVLDFMETRGATETIVVVTADMGLSLKAPTRQIEIVVPDEHLQRDDEPDETERELEATRRKLTALRAVAPRLKLTLDGENVLEYEVPRFAEFGTEKLDQLLKAWRSNHPYISHEPGSSAGLSVLLSQKAAAQHNATIERVYGEYATFLRQWPTRLNALARCVEVRFVLENAGTAPADDVDILVTARADGVWLEELPELPRPPVVPRPRSPFESITTMPPFHHFDPSRLSFRDDPVHGPIILKDEPHHVQYTVKRVKHHVPCDLPVAYFQFDTDEHVRSFTMKCRLVAANIPKPKQHDLHAKLSVSTLTEPPSPEELLDSGDDSDSAVENEEPNDDDSENSR